MSPASWEDAADVMRQALADDRAIIERFRAQAAPLYASGTCGLDACAVAGFCQARETDHCPDREVDA